jgi:hypothetical protein
MNTIKLAVVGSRSITNRELIHEHLDYYLKQAHKINKEIIIVSGGAKGVDSIAEDWAKDRGLITIVVYPAWNDKNGNFVRSAGFKRNEVIWDIAECGVAFWDRVSKGTEHSFQLAKERNKKIAIIEADELPF